ncbi:RnfABCDGE type electron transport complex subunit G [Vallitalea okinawensis]|uniref:RnfABCDGE type electron transport complex subunit G n=1 Tax=Vallitalea okinawensis TaxID=2078660 RepID=UPI000CFAEA36|nr:RnfABCDGE type electron transport complex subunit G [Vallitalea okinawensis]
MSKLNNTENILVLGLVLFIITAIAGALLGFVDEMTYEPRMTQMEKAKNEALKMVLSEADGFDSIDVDSTSFPSIVEAYKATNDAGYAMKVTTKGYGGTIVLFVGLDKEGVVTGMHMLQHQETPGLGANANNPEFKDQFPGKGPEVIGLTKNAPSESEVQAITGATITSNAIVNGVNDALAYYEDILAGEEQ